MLDFGFCQRSRLNTNELDIFTENTRYTERDFRITFRWNIKGYYDIINTNRQGIYRQFPRA